MRAEILRDEIVRERGGIISSSCKMITRARKNCNRRRQKILFTRKSINGRLKGHMNDGAADVVQNTFLQLTWSNRPLHSLHNPAAYFRRAAARKNP